MFEREISEAEVRRVLETGDEIATYPDDKPYPTRLLLGRPIQGALANRPAATSTCRSWA